tara:strand:+ start:17940 stop:18227 length:288 start_codon:yes stop_codon:yes gene_type:complete
MPRNKKGEPILYKPFKNTTDSKKKFFVYVKADTKKGYKKIGFGHKDYEDYTQHKDGKRRSSYLKRAKGIKNKEGNLTWKDKNTPNYWAVHYLWNG